jgi:hypothetical protein
MGQKINPIGLRLGINRTWDSRWFANKSEYGNLLQEDLNIRRTLMEELKQAAVSKIVIERPHRKCRVSIHTARPGIVIGKKGADIDKIRAKVKKFTDSEVHINIVEVRKPETDATLVAQGIAQISLVRNGTAKAVCRCIRCAPTSITARPKHRPLMASSASRSGSSRAKCLSMIPVPTNAALPKRPAARARASVVNAVIVKIAAIARRRTEKADNKCCNLRRPSSARPIRVVSMASPRVARN